MDKLRLNLDDLRVESFDTTPEGARGTRGTVFAYEPQNTWVTAGVYCSTACGICSVQETYCACSGDTCYSGCTYGVDSCGQTCATDCVGSCPLEETCGCQYSGSWTCEGSTCYETCGATCGCETEPDPTSPCICI